MHSMTENSQNEKDSKRIKPIRSSYAEMHYRRHRHDLNVTRIKPNGIAKTLDDGSNVMTGLVRDVKRVHVRSRIRKSELYPSVHHRKQGPTGTRAAILRPAKDRPADRRIDRSNLMENRSRNPPSTARGAVHSGVKAEVTWNSKARA